MKKIIALTLVLMLCTMIIIGCSSDDDVPVTPASSGEDSSVADSAPSGGSAAPSESAEIPQPPALPEG